MTVLYAKKRFGVGIIPDHKIKDYGIIGGTPFMSGYIITAIL